MRPTYFLLTLLCGALLGVSVSLIGYWCHQVRLQHPSDRQFRRFLRQASHDHPDAEVPGMSE